MTNLKLKYLVSVFFSFTILFIFTSEAYARAGGGSNSGGGFLYFILAPFALIYMWYVNRKINQKNKKVESVLKDLAAKDPEWNEAHLEEIVRKKFFEIQADWCANNLTSLKEKLCPNIFEAWKVQIEDLKEKGYRNKMDDLHIFNVRFVEVKNHGNRNEDIFTACIDAGAADYTVDGNGKIVFSNSYSSRKRKAKEKSREDFREFWTFKRKDGDWLLQRVDQSANWKKIINEPVVSEGSSALRNADALEKSAFQRTAKITVDDKNDDKNVSWGMIIIVLVSAMSFAVYGFLFYEITGHIPRSTGLFDFGPGWWEFDVVLIPCVLTGFLVKIICEKIAGRKL